MKSIAKGYAYQPGMDKDIESLVRQCDKCQQAAKNRFTKILCYDHKRKPLESGYMSTSRTRGKVPGRSVNGWKNKNGAQSDAAAEENPARTGGGAIRRAVLAVNTPGYGRGNKLKTKYINDNLNPEWNESLEFDLKNEALTPNDELDVSVFDHDDISVDKFMGKVMVPLGSLITGEKEKKESLTLNDKNGQATQQSIQLVISYQPPDAGSGGAGGGAAAGESGGGSSGGGGGGSDTDSGIASDATPGGAIVGSKKKGSSDLLPAIDKSYSTKVQDFQRLACSLLKSEATIQVPIGANLVSGMANPRVKYV
ncbi:hypothetical protein ACTXT7_004800 [Hymenolepis weldensis]